MTTFLRVALLTALLSALPCLVMSQGVFIPPQVAFETVNGVTRPIPGAAITVCAAAASGIPCSPVLLSTIFKDAALSQPLTNPFFADANGNYTFAAASGTYTVTVTALGFSGYSYQITLGGSGGGGGSGTVGPCTPNFMAKFTGNTAVGCSTVTDDGVTPTRAPDGVNAANSGFFNEWVVDTGGVVANKLVCRSAAAAAKVVICPPGATNTVIGVAQSTQPAGNTVIVGEFGKQNVISSNNTTQKDWLIPSLSIAGDVDDIGSTLPPANGTITWPAETTVLAGNAVLVTFQALDTLAQASASGTISPCTIFGIGYYSAATTLNCIFPNPTPAGAVFYPQWGTPAGTLVAPIATQAGLPPRIFSGTSDTIGCADRAPGAVYYRNTSAATATVPDVGSACFASSPVFKVVLDKATAPVTFNRTAASTFTVCSGTATCSPATTSFTLTSGQSATFSTPDAANWDVLTTPLQSSVPSSPTPSWKNTSGNYTVPDSENGYHDRNSGANSTITLGTPNSIAASPVVAQRLAVGNISSTPFTTGTFSQTAGHQALIIVTNDSGTAQPVSSILNSSGDSIVKLCEAIVTGTQVSMWWNANTSASGSETLTVTFAGAPGRSQIYETELQGATLDVSSCTTGNNQISAPVHYANALAIAASYGSIPAGWGQLGTVNSTEEDDQLLHNVSSVLYATGNVNTALGIVTFGISATPTYISGWTVTAENVSTGMQSLTASGGALLNGLSSIPLFPNESCLSMSNGTGYDVTCGFAPSIQTLGVNSAIYAVDQTPGVASIGATTMLTTASAPVSRYMLSGRATVTVIGASCAGNTTVVLNAIYTDPLSAGGTTTLPLGTFTVTTNGTIGVSSGSFTPVIFEAKGSTAIQFSTTYTAGGSCSPAPTVQVTPILQVM